MKIHYIAIAYLSLLALSLIDNSRGPAYSTLLSSLNINNQTGSLIFSVASMFGLLANVSARYWLPKLGYFLGTSISMLLMGTGSLLFGASVSYTSTTLMIISSICFGLGAGISMITMNVLVARGAKHYYRAKAFSGLHAIYGMGSIISPLVFNLFLESTWPWFWYFYILGLLPILLFLYPFLFSRDKTQNEQVPNLTAPTNVLTRILFGLFLSLYVSSELLVSTRISIFLEKSFSFSKTEANTYLSLYFVGLTLGRILFAVKSISTSAPTLIICSYLGTITFFILGYSVHPIFFAMTGLSMSFFFPTTMNLIAHKFPTGLEYMTASVMVSIGISLMTVHYFFGILAEYIGLFSAMAAAPIMQFLGMIAFIYLKNKDYQIGKRLV